MGNLVDTIFSLYLDQVLSAHDISEPAGNFIGALFRNATRNMSELFDEHGTGSTGASISSAGELPAAKIAKAGSYGEKFDAVGKFMFMSLTDINAGLGDGTFKSVTGQELSKLIVAAFDDSQKRADTLRLLSVAEK
jgi:centromere/kinetochore protein ZW10